MEKNIALLSSYIEGADDSLFPIHNLPFGIFSDQTGKARVGTAIGPYVLDLAQLDHAGLLPLNTTQSVFNQTSLNAFAALGNTAWKSVRRRLQVLLSKENHELQNHASLRKLAFISMEEVTMLLPFKIEGFSDFYASEQHATNVGKLFRPDNPLLPNWKYLPVAYNGRASTIFPSGTKIPRPKGQIKLVDQERPMFSPSQKLDFELEMGIFIGVGNPEGQPIALDQARSHIFGLTLLNDWSARDIQAFEYQPLGPFLSKSFATSISSWVISMDALEGCMRPLPKQVPEVVSYLHHPELNVPEIKLKVEIIPKGSQVRTTICETNSRELYWSLEQMLAHHTINHCIMKTGDLLGSGTISGASRENWGSLLEITANGTQPLVLADGSQRRFLEDGDTIIMSGYAETDYYKIGFGHLEGAIYSS